MKKLLFTVVGLLLVVGCFGGNDETKDKKNTQDNNNGIVDSNELKAEYKAIVAEMDAAIEQGYVYESFMQEYKRSGSYIQVGNPQTTLFRVGNDEGKHFQIVAVGGEYTQIDEMEISDGVKDNTELLKKQLLSHSTNNSYSHIENSWNVIDVDIKEEGNATIITVTSTLASASSSRDHVATYTISDGLIENYTLDSGTGSLQVFNYTFKSKGPIDPTPIIDLYNDIKEQSANF